MLLKNVLSNLDFYSCDEKLLNKKIKHIEIDPNKVKEGTLFVSLKRGSEAIDNIIKAQKKGAVAFLSQEDYGACKQILVDDVRSAYALVSKRFSYNACDRLKIIAVTGTNGKTTTTKIIGDILRASCKKVGTIGTLGAKVNGKMIDTGFTTPDPEILHPILYDMQRRGVEYVVMEASAHSLELKKLDGIKFEASVFTNLTQDHLDFFGNMEKYYKAKEKLFSFGKSKVGIVCIDDKYAERIVEKGEVPVLTYSFGNEADCFASEIESTIDGSKFTCNALGEVFKVESNFVGDYNVQNLLGAVLTARILGISNTQIKSAIKQITPAEGRFNQIVCNGRSIIVDFAHTPDGLEKVLKCARGITENKLLCVFGCGGNRDKEKRPIMGSIAERLCDEVFVTSDNPRFEKPCDIIGEIEKGMKKDNHRVIENREDAIIEAIKSCKNGDTLVVAGKGGEKYQDIGGKKFPYNDFDAIKKGLEILLNDDKEKRYAD